MLQIFGQFFYRLWLITCWLEIGVEFKLHKDILPHVLIGTF
jgi:hypothetical protein